MTRCVRPDLSSPDPTETCPSGWPKPSGRFRFLTPKMPQSSPLPVAPPFELPTPLGEVRTLDSFLKKGRLLLMFHRGTW